MRLKERGLGTGAIIGIVVVVIVVAIVVPVTAIVLLGGGGALGTLPVYPGAKDAGISVEQAVQSVGASLPAGWSGKVYTTQENATDVISWYKTQMSGWTKTADNTMESGGMTIYVLAYEKGNDVAIIETFGVTGYGNYLILLAGPKGTSTPAPC